MTESFAELFQESLKKTNMRSGDIVAGTVVKIDNKYAYVNIGLKSEALVPKEQFTNDIQIGNEIEVVVEAASDLDTGRTKASYEKAKRVRTWK